jgi:hypothetical protein
MNWDELLRLVRKAMFQRPELVGATLYDAREQNPKLNMINRRSVHCISTHILVDDRAIRQDRPQVFRERRLA